MSLFSASEESSRGIFITTNNNMLGEQVVSPVYIPATKAVGGLKNVDCSPKVKMEAMQLLALCDWVRTHHGIKC